MKVLLHMLKEKVQETLFSTTLLQGPGASNLRRIELFPTPCNALSILTCNAVGSTGSQHFEIEKIYILFIVAVLIVARLRIVLLDK